MLRASDKRLHLNKGLRDIQAGGTSIYGDATGGIIGAILQDSPKAFWPMQEASGLPQDISGNGLHLTSSGGTVTAAQSGPHGSDFAYSLALSGTLSRASAIFTSAGDCAFEFVCNVTDMTGQNNMIFNGTPFSNSCGVWGEANGKFEYLCGNIAFGTQSSTTIEDAGWMHIVVQRASTQWQYWVNGSADGASLGTTGYTGAGASFLIGSANIEWKIAYLAVYEASLSSTRIAAHAALAV